MLTPSKPCESDHCPSIYPIDSFTISNEKPPFEFNLFSFFVQSLVGVSQLWVRKEGLSRWETTLILMMEVEK